MSDCKGYSPDPEAVAAHQKYLEWKKGAAELVVDYEHVFPQQDGTVILHVRNGDRDLRVGAWVGGQEVLKVEAYQKELDRLPGGWTGIVTLAGMPGFTVEETYPEFAEWLRTARARRKAKEGV